MRCHSRLSRSQQAGTHSQRHDAAEELFDLLDLVEGIQETTHVGFQLENPSAISDLRAMVHQLAGNADNRDDDDDEEASVNGEEPGVEDMEEDDTWGDQDNSSEEESEESEADFDEAESDEERNEDDFMDADMVETSQRSDDQPRSVSVSSDDL